MDLIDVNSLSGINKDETDELIVYITNILSKTRDEDTSRNIANIAVSWFASRSKKVTTYLKNEFFKRRPRTESEVCTLLRVTRQEFESNWLNIDDTTL